MDIATGFSQHAIDNSLTYAIFHSIDLPGVPEWIEKKIDKRIFGGLTKIKVYREVFSFVERGGLYAGDKFLEWIREKLEAKGKGWGEATLEEFYKATGCDLSLVASNTESQEMLVLNHRTAPLVPVAWAVRMSMSIPFVWQEVLWREQWGEYRGTKLTGNTIVDGGALSNFPLDLLISSDKSVTDVMGDTNPDGADTLGFLIDETLEVAGAPEREVDEGTDDDKDLMASAKRLKTVHRVTKLMDTMMTAHDKTVIDANADKVCRLPAKGYGTTEFDMSEKRLEALVNAGRTAMSAYFNLGS